MTKKHIRLTSRSGQTASYSASTSGSRWCVYRVTFGWLGDTTRHVGCAGSLQDAVEVAKTDAGFPSARTDIR